MFPDMDSKAKIQILWVMADNMPATAICKENQDDSYNDTKCKTHVVIIICVASNAANDENRTI